MYYEFSKIKSLNKQLITVESFDYFRTVFTTALNYDFQSNNVKDAQLDKNLF